MVLLGGRCVVVGRVVEVFSYCEGLSLLLLAFLYDSEERGVDVALAVKVCVRGAISILY